MKSLFFKSSVTFSLMVSAGCCEAAAGPAETVLFYGNSLAERLLEDGKTRRRISNWRSPKTHSMSAVWRGLGTKSGIGCGPRVCGPSEGVIGTLAGSDHCHWFWKQRIVCWNCRSGSFRKDWEVFLREITRQHPGAKLVLLSPIAVQNGGTTDVRTRNNEIHQYAVLLKKSQKRTELSSLICLPPLAMRSTVCPAHNAGISSEYGGAWSFGKSDRRQVGG